MGTLLTNPTFASVLMTIAAFIGHRVAIYFGDKSNSKLESAIAAIRSVMQAIVTSAAPGMSLDDLHVALVGAASIQLARAGLDPSNALVKAGVDAAVTEFLGAFVAVHPTPSALHEQLRGIMVPRAPAAAAAAPPPSSPVVQSAAIALVFVLAFVATFTACAGAQRTEVVSEAVCGAQETAKIVDILDDKTKSGAEKLLDLAVNIEPEIAACVLKQHQPPPAPGSGSE